MAEAHLMAKLLKQYVLSFKQYWKCKSENKIFHMNDLLEPRRPFNEYIRLMPFSFSLTFSFSLLFASFPLLKLKYSVCFDVDGGRRKYKINE